MANRKSQQVPSFAQDVISFFREHPLVALFAVCSALYAWSVASEGLPNTTASVGQDGACKATVLKSPSPLPPADADGRILIPAGTTVILSSNCFKTNTNAK